MEKRLSASDAILERKSTRRFSSREVRDQTIYEILELSNRAPSGYNLQPWHFILVRDPELRGLLHHVALEQKQIVEAPITLVFVSDPHAWKTDFTRILRESVEKGLISEEYAQLTRRNVNSHFRTEPFGLFGFVKRITHPLRRLKKPAADPFSSFDEISHYMRSQTMLAASTFMIAAAGAGLATNAIEGFDERRLKQLLAIPRRMSVPLIVAVGYSLEGDEQPESLRLPLLEKLSVDVFPNKLSRLKKKGKGFAGQKIE
jgi:nitroreductase